MSTAEAPKSGATSPASLLAGPLAVLKRNSGLIILLGVLSLVLGLLALGESVFVTVGAIWVFGVILIVCGIGNIVQSLSLRGWRGFTWHLLLGLLYLAAGISAATNPLPASLLITLVIGFAFIFGGVLRVVLAFQHRPLPSWPLTLVNGIIGVVLGGMIVSGWPATSLFIIGLFVAVELITTGISWIMVGVAARKLA